MMNSTFRPVKTESILKYVFKLSVSFCLLFTEKISGGGTQPGPLGSHPPSLPALASSLRTRQRVGARNPQKQSLIPFLITEETKTQMSELFFISPHCLQNCAEVSKSQCKSLTSYFFLDLRPSSVWAEWALSCHSLLFILTALLPDTPRCCFLGFPTHWLFCILDDFSPSCLHLHFS